MNCIQCMRELFTGDDPYRPCLFCKQNNNQLKFINPDNPREAQRLNMEHFDMPISFVNEPSFVKMNEELKEIKELLTKIESHLGPKVVQINQKVLLNE